MASWVPRHPSMLELEGSTQSPALAAEERGLERDSDLSRAPSLGGRGSIGSALVSRDGEVSGQEEPGLL